MVLHALGTCPTCSAQAGRGRELPSILYRLHDALIRLPVRVPQKDSFDILLAILASDEIGKLDFSMYHEYYLSSLLELLGYLPRHALKEHGLEAEELGIKIHAVNVALNMADGWYLKETVDKMRNEGRVTAELMRWVCVNWMAKTCMAAEEKAEEKAAGDEGSLGQSLSRNKDEVKESKEDA
jgi:hypothetical protein